MRVVPAVVGVERNWSPSEPSRRTRTIAAAWSRTAGTGGSPGTASAGPRRFPTTLPTVPPTPPGRADPHRGSRRLVEECFQRAKQKCGLDDHQVRRSPSRRRHTTLAMAAHACPDRSAHPPARHGQRRNGSSQLIHLSLAEIRRLIARLTDRHPTPAGHILHRSDGAAVANTEIASGTTNNEAQPVKAAQQSESTVAVLTGQAQTSPGCGSGCRASAAFGSHSLVVRR